MDQTPSTPPLSVALRELIDKRNILTTRTKSKVLHVLDEHIVASDIQQKEDNLKSRALDEIYTSEESYLRNLEVAMKFFKKPLLEGKFVLPSSLKVLFEHLESVYNVNGELLNLLGSDGEDVGAAFQKIAPFFKLYSVYAYNYREGITALLEVCKTNGKLASFIKQQETRPEVCCKLSSLLISPIQRVPRYRLLLRELLHHTPSNHPHHSSILDALREVEKATEHINSLVSDQEMMRRMVELQRCLLGGKPELIHPGRRLIKEGVLMKVSKSKDKANSRYFILTSDVLMYCKMSGSKVGENSLRCCCVLPLCRTHVSQVLNDKLFNVTCNSVSLILYSPEPYASESWVSAIRKTIQEENESQQTLKRRGSARLASLRKDLNQISNTFTPRKRKQEHAEDEILTPFHSPWKRNKVKTETEKEKCKEEKPGPSGVNTRRLGYFSSFRKIFSTLGHSLQKYWVPAITGKENSDTPKLT